MTNLRDTYRRYNMHKYWGKKPASGLTPLINRYSKPGDVLLDPFSGYGVFCIESYLSNRNIIANDLNPIANFITSVILDKDINITLLKQIWEKICKEFEPYVDDWYNIEIENKLYKPISILRNKHHYPIAFTYRDGKNTVTKEIPNHIANLYVEKESNSKIKDWYPQNRLIINSRISSHAGMAVADVFTKRTLACHARLLALIKEYASGQELNLLLLAFTANLANCSKLVPPIKSRGLLSQGAWMTGFYIADNYIENNVLHYFKNRLSKAISGKEEFLCHVKQNHINSNIKYAITNNDAKHLNIDSESIDYIFTDPPYGDSVPYFEQSVIWNSWLNLIPDYQNEIVISDSIERNKDIFDYSKGIYEAITEICRVLKKNHFFSITYHSLSGAEWKAITNACIKNNLIVDSFEWLEQATLPPRQLTRMKTVKGDVLVTFIKSANDVPYIEMSDEKFKNKLKVLIDNCILSNKSDTNSIMMKIMEWVLRERIIIAQTDVFEFLNYNYNINSDGIWK